MYGDRQEIFVLLFGPKSKFLSLEYSTRLLSIKFFNFLTANSFLGLTLVYIIYISIKLSGLAGVLRSLKDPRKKGN